MNLDRKPWPEFLHTGLFWWINNTLHVFGWAIVVVVEDDGSVTEVYPARIRGISGFPRQVELESKEKIAAWMVEHGGTLQKDLRGILKAESGKDL